MEGCEPCGARNQSTENESDMYQHHLSCTSHDRGRKAVIRRRLHMPQKFDKCTPIPISAQKDIKNRLSKARNAFTNLGPVWWSMVYRILTKLNLYNRIYNYNNFFFKNFSFVKFFGIARCLNNTKLH